MKRKNLVLSIVALLILAAVIAWALQPQAVAVEAAPVTRGLFEQIVRDDGRTRVLDRYVVSAPLAGRVERIRLEVGDPVKQGQTVALLTPTAPAFLDARTARELQERVGAAEAQFARTKAETAKVLAQRDQARADLDRQTRLSKEGFVSATAREQAELALRTTERAVEAARFAEEAAGHDVGQARAALSRYKSGEPGARWQVTSPVNGTVLRVVQQSESAVALGAPLLELADVRSLEAVVDVLSQEAVAIRAGMPARLDLGQGLQPLTGRVRLVEPAAFTKVSALGVEEQRVNVIIDFVDPIEKIETVGDGYRVEADIAVLQVDDAIKAPVAALFREGEGWAVFALEGDERVTKRVVKAPRRNATEALIEDGLKPGERVVVYPSDALRDGSKVEVTRTSGR